MPPKNSKVSLKFMDIAVKLEGGRNTEKRALSLFSVLLKDRLKVYDVLNTLEDCEDEEAKTKPAGKKKKLMVEREIITDVMYA